MAVRIKESTTPYKAGIGIEITNNHIINVLLREANNLIHVNENNELYVDLQLPDGIEPDDDFPVWVTTGKILQEDWWQQSGLILNRKTTSWDYARLIYANDWNLYVDLWDWVWQLIWWWQVIADINTKTFYLPNSVTDVSNPDLEEIQKAMDWYFDTKNSILWYQDEMYVFYEDITRWQNPSVCFIGTDLMKVSWENDGTAHLWRKFIKVYIDTDTNTVTSVEAFSETQDRWCSYIPTNVTTREWFRPTQLNHPISLWYLNEELAKKQDLLTAWTRITIQTDPNTGDLVISADVSWVMTYKGNVTDPSQLPASGNVWDCWYSESDWHMYAWDWTQWKDIWGIAPNLTNYFNKTIDDSDDITQWSINLFVTQSEKNTWNNKQDKLTAGQNITIDPLTNEISATDTKYYAGNNITIDQNNHIHNDAPFDPDNAGSMGQVLTKTSNWYEWKKPVSWVSSVNWKIWDVTVSEFEPDNQGTDGQVLTKTPTGYEWKNGWWGSSYSAWHWININQNNVISNSLPFEPDNQWQSWQVLKTDWNGNCYWANESWGGSSYTAGDWINIDSNNVISNTNRFIPSNQWTAWQMLVKTQNWYEWSNLPSNKNNVKFWTIDLDNQVTATNREIYEWLQASTNNWAIINIESTNHPEYKDTYIFESINQSGMCIFHWISRNSEKREWIWAWWQSRWWYTIAWQWELQLFWPFLTNYGIVIWENPNDLTHTNYISALWAQYPSAFMPTDDTQPATKWYVDAAILGWWGGALWITNNTWWTTTRVTQIWWGTTAEWNAIQNPSNTCIYIELE